MKRILIIQESLNVGGAETLLTSILPYIDSSKYEINLLLLHKGGSLNDLLPSNVKVKCYFSNAFKYYLWRAMLYFGIFLNYYSIKDKEYDSILSFLEGPSCVVHWRLLKGGKRNVTWVHTDFLRNHWSSKYFFNSRNEYLFYSKMSKIVFVSHAAKFNFKKVYNVDDSIIEVLTNAVDGNNIVEKSKLIKLNKEKFTVCNVGRLDVAKRQERIVNIARYIIDKGYDFHFWIVGSGKEEERLKAFIKKRRVENNVFLKGYQSNPYPFMKYSDVFILTSDYEGYPMALCEALCLGKPIVSTKVTGAEELLSNGVGILCDKDEKLLADALIELYENSEKRLNMENNALLASRKFSLETYINKFIGILLK